MANWARTPSRAVGTAAILSLALSSVLGGCGSTGFPYRPDAPLVATLPVEASGVRDRRAIFGALLVQELQRARLSAPSESSRFYLQVPDEAHVASAALSSIQKRAASNMPGTSVLVIPGIFGDCVDEQSLPFGDGKLRSPATVGYREGYSIYAGDFPGVEIRALQVPGRASSEANGLLIAEAIKIEAARPEIQRIVLIAYSKGMADALHAIDSLAVPGGVPLKLRAIVSVAGVVMGTPLADRYATLHDVLAPSFVPLGCSASTGGEVQSLARSTRRTWLASRPLPDKIQYHSIVAHADPDRISPGLRSFYRMLRRFDDRNDGQMIAMDAVLPHSDLLAVVKSDHWTFVLPLAQHPSPIVRSMAADEAFPREALLRTTLTYVLGTLTDSMEFDRR